MARRTSTQTESSLRDVWIGMPVVDVTGKLVGTIRSVHATLPTAQKSAVCLQVAGAGLMDNDCYVSAEQIAVTDEDQVALLVTARELTIDDGRWI